MHAGIFGNAMVEAVTGSTSKLTQGDVGGAFKAASGAVAQAQEQADQANRSFQSSVPRLLSCVTLVFVVGCLWGAEHLLALRSEQDPMMRGSEVFERELGQDFYQFPALGTLRFILSCMVLLFNFYPWTVQEVKSRQAHTLSVFASWGVLAAPLFFTLSGFCHSYAKMVGSKAQLEEDIVSAVVVRVMAWYPYYVITLIFLCVVFFSYSAWDWSSFTAQVFLVSGAFEDHSGATFPYLPGSWWFSLLAVYTLAWHPMHMILKNSLNSVIWTMFTVATTVVIPSVILEYLFMSDMAIFQLIQYSPSFFFGQALAVWQVNNCMVTPVPSQQSTAPATPGRPLHTLQPVAEMPFSARFGVTTSVLILGMVMIFISPFDEVPIVRKPCAAIFTKGLLLPVFGLLIVGLCNEADPLARLIGRPVFSWAGRLSLSMFLLALPVRIVMKVWLGISSFGLVFLALLAASVAGYFLIEVPSRRFASYLALFMNQKVQK